MNTKFTSLNICLLIVCPIIFGFCQKPKAKDQITPVKVASLPYTSGSRISWDNSSLKKVSTGSGYNGYARLIQLNNGSLICTYESDGNVLVVNSSDTGKTWSSPIIVAAKSEGVNMAVPDVLQLKDGSILICYNPRPTSSAPEKKFAIRTKKSYDNGLTWTDSRLLYEAGYQFGNGCWEPAAIQLPNGEIQLFFANEGVYTSSNEQNISLIRSLDNGLSWTNTPQIVSFRNGSRDGMPVPLLLKNGTDIVFAIEDNGFSDFKPYIIKNSLAENWATIVDASSNRRSYALSDKIAENIYAGAPFLRQLASGETILSYQGTEGRENKLDFAEMKVVIGNEEARSFNRKSSPFKIPASKSGLWNSLSVIEGNLVVALTSTNAFSSGSSEVWMIKGHVIPELQAISEKIYVDGTFNEISWTSIFPIFVGHKGLTQATAQISSDADFLYILTKVNDQNIVTNASNVEESDGVSVFVHARDLTYNLPEKGVFKVFVSADNKVVVKEGENGNWAKRELGTVKSFTIKSDGFYRQEIAIPWQVLGGKPVSNSLIGFNFGLTENSGNVNLEYKETITTCLEMQPSTWMTLGIK